MYVSAGCAKDTNFSVRSHNGRKTWLLPTQWLPRSYLILTKKALQITEEPFYFYN
jgi:hypothetical protein